MQKTTVALAFFAVVGLGCQEWAYVPGTSPMGPPYRPHSEAAAHHEPGLAAASPVRSGAADVEHGGGHGGDAAKGEEACLDNWLKGKNLDPYGNPPGTMYAGGSPLFNDATGEQTKRTDFVYSKHPDAQAACSK